MHLTTEFYIALSILIISYLGYISLKLISSGIRRK